MVCCLLSALLLLSFAKLSDRIFLCDNGYICFYFENAIRENNQMFKITEDGFGLCKSVMNFLKHHCFGPRQEEEDKDAVWLHQLLCALQKVKLKHYEIVKIMVIH